MGRISFAAVIYERFKTKDGKYPVKLRVTYNKKPTYYATGIVAEPGELILNSPQANIPIKNTSKGNMLKFRIHALIMTYEKASEEFDPTLFPEWTVNEVMAYLRKAIRRENGFRLDFVEFCNSFIEEKAKTSKKAADNYKRAISLLCAYIGKDEFDISIITSSLMNSWEQHLRQQYGDTARTVSMATSHIASMHRAARKQYNSEEMDEVNIRNPFEYYTPPKQPASEHRAINGEIIQHMINTYNDLKGREKLAIGAFLLSFGLMGMNTPDIYECKAPECGVLKYNRHKTKMRRDDHAAMEVKIPDCIMPLFEEYRDHTRKRAFNFYHRYKTYGNMEDAETKGMQEYKRRIGFNGPLTNYSARHTWATIARSSKCNISMELIDDCLAHVGTHRIGDIYAKKDFSVLWEANEKVLSTFDWAPLSA